MGRVSCNVQGTRLKAVDKYVHSWPVLSPFVSKFQQAEGFARAPRDFDKSVSAHSIRQVSPTQLEGDSTAPTQAVEIQQLRACSRPDSCTILSSCG